MFLKFFKSLTFQLFFAIFAAYFFVPYANKSFVTLAFTVSTFLKSILLIILPFVVFSYIFSAMIKFAKSAPLFLGILLISVLASVCLALNFAMVTSKLVLPFLVQSGTMSFSQGKEPIEAAFTLSIPEFWTAGNAMLIGLLVGIFFGLVRLPYVCRFSEQLRDIATYLLKKFVAFLPLFVFGFVAELRYHDLINALVINYGKCFVFTLIALFAYIFFMMLIINNFSLKNAWRNFQACFGVILTAATTMSSLATLPLSLKVVKKHTHDQEYAGFIMPITVNIHMLGDCFMFGVATIAALYLFDLPQPSLWTFVQFNFLYLISRFSVAGVPSGSVLVTMPIMQALFHFPNEVVGILTTLCILQDGPIATVGNTTGNVVLAELMHKLFGRFLKVQPCEI